MNLSNLENIINQFDQGSIPTVSSVSEQEYVTLIQDLQLAGQQELQPDTLFINQLETKILKGGNPMNAFLQKLQTSPLAWVGGGLVVLFLLANTVALPMDPLGFYGQSAEEGGVVSRSSTGSVSMGTTMDSRESKMMIAPDIAPMPPYYGGAEDLDNPNRSVVRSGNLGLIVEDVSAAITEATTYIDSIGGFVTNSSINKFEDRYQGYVALRVPQTEFSAAIGYLKRLALEVESEEVSAYDQTGQVTQADEELIQLRAQLAQYEELLRNAATNEEKINLQPQIEQVRREIRNWEQQQGQLEGQEEMSQIWVNFTEQEWELPIIGKLGLNDTFIEAGQSLKRTLAWLVVLVIWVVVFAPIWIPLWLILKWWKKKV